ncbi:MAG: hypothetical protein ABH851_01880 [Methanobacteriota archaeon]
MTQKRVLRPKRPSGLASGTHSSKGLVLSYTGPKPRSIEGAVPAIIDYTYNGIISAIQDTPPDEISLQLIKVIDSRAAEGENPVPALKSLILKDKHQAVKIGGMIALGYNCLKNPEDLDDTLDALEALFASQKEESVIAAGLGVLDAIGRSHIPGVDRAINRLPEIALKAKNPYIRNGCNLTLGRIGASTPQVADDCVTAMVPIILNEDDPKVNSFRLTHLSKIICSGNASLPHLIEIVNGLYGELWGKRQDAGAHGGLSAAKVNMYATYGRPAVDATVETMGPQIDLGRQSKTLWIGQ